MQPNTRAHLIALPCALLAGAAVAGIVIGRGLYESAIGLQMRLIIGGLGVLFFWIGVKNTIFPTGTIGGYHGTLGSSTTRGDGVLFLVLGLMMLVGTAFGDLIGAWLWQLILRWDAA